MKGIDLFYVILHGSPPPIRAIEKDDFNIGNVTPDLSLQLVLLQLQEIIELTKSISDLVKMETLMSFWVRFPLVIRG